MKFSSSTHQSEEQQANETAAEKIQQQERDIARLCRYIECMHYDIAAIEDSRAWKLGYLIMRWVKRLLGRSKTSDSFASIHDTFALYHHWKKTRD